MFEVGSLARTVYTHQIAVVLQQDNGLGSTQVFVGGEKRWIHTHKLRRIPGNK